MAESNQEPQADKSKEDKALIDMSKTEGWKVLVGRIISGQNIAMRNAQKSGERSEDICKAVGMITAYSNVVSTVERLNQR
jgi:hypothetical protein